MNILDRISREPALTVLSFLEMCILSSVSVVLMQKFIYCNFRSVVNKNIGPKLRQPEMQASVFN